MMEEVKSPRRWGQHLTPNERMLAALFFNADEPDDVPWLVIVNDRETGGQTFYGPYDTELAAIEARDEMAADFKDEFGDTVSFIHARLYPGKEQ